LRVHARSGDPPAEVRGSPFSLSAEAEYAQWRTAKISGYPKSAGEIRVPVRNLAKPTPAERDKLYAAIARSNMAIYVTEPASSDAEIPLRRQELSQFLAELDLQSVEKHRSAEADGFVSIAVSDAPAKRDFIPYTSRPLNWHTDGYYAPASEPIRSFLLHCVRNASTGGENALLDPEIVYLRLRDADPSWLEALMHPEAMTIPAAVEEDGSVRPESIGPVFAIDPRDGSLISRYTARGRNIAWRDTPATRHAVEFLERLLKDAAEPLIIKAALMPGEGLICNNVLHTRTAFVEAEGNHRLLYRARFARRIAPGDATRAHAA
jgi:alpha-ketoglutarate-dependent taurine dioxygenase